MYPIVEQFLMQFMAQAAIDYGFTPKDVPIHAVGGVVRDFLANVKTPKDLDFCTAFTPDMVTHILSGMGYSRKQLDLKDAAMGVVRVNYEGWDVEIATYRKETYTPGNRTPKIEFTKHLYVDLGRRDFNVNAIAWNPYVDFTDVYDGIDEKTGRLSKHISPVTEWEVSFDQDPLRHFRLRRIKATFGLSLEPYIFDHEFVGSCASLSPQKAMTEIWKGLELGKQEYVNWLTSSGALDAIVPFFRFHRFCQVNTEESVIELWARILWNGIYNRHWTRQQNLAMVEKSLKLMGESKANISSIMWVLNMTAKEGQL